VAPRAREVERRPQGVAAWGVLRALLLAALLVLPATGAADVHGVPLPPGSRLANGGGFRSSRSFRRTVEFYQRLLRRRSTPHEAIPIYRYRGVTLGRFLSRAQGTKWSAIQVVLLDGQTRIFILPGKERLDEPEKPR